MAESNNKIIFGRIKKMQNKIKCFIHAWEIFTWYEK